MKDHGGWRCETCNQRVSIHVPADCVPSYEPVAEMECDALRAEVERLRDALESDTLTGKRVYQLLEQRDALLAAVEREKRELDAAVDHCRQKSKRIRELESGITDSVCAYCGVRFKESGTELISAHVRVCEKHPLRADIDRLAAEVERLNGLMDSAGTPKNWREIWISHRQATVREQKENDRLRAQLATARAALEWYANGKNYDEETGAAGEWHRDPSTVLGPGETHFQADGGYRAEQALAALDAGKEGGE